MIPEIIFLVEHAREDAHELNGLVCLVPGQGVVMEGSPFSDYAQVEAAFNQGWIDIESKHQLLPTRWLHLHCCVGSVSAIS